MIDLQTFCCDEEDGCPYFERPFSIGSFSYATNRHILVRVDRRPDVPDLAEVFPGLNIAKIPAVLDGIDAAIFDVARPKLPPAGIDDGPCLACDGDGGGHLECPTCHCFCSACGGGGIVGGIASIDVAGKPFRVGYMRWLAALPGLALAEAPSIVPGPGQAGVRLFFRFHGGCGTLCGLRKPCETHFDRHGVRVVAE